MGLKNGLKYFARIPKRACYNARDLLLNKYIGEFLITNNLQYGALLYSVLSANPTQIAISVLALKMGLSKSVIMIILLFLI